MEPFEKEYEELFGWLFRKSGIDDSALKGWFTAQRRLAYQKGREEERTEIYKEMDKRQLDGSSEDYFQGYEDAKRVVIEHLTSKNQ